MSKVTTDCPHCRKLNVVEKSSASMTGYGYRIRCSHCSKSWDESLGEDASFFKSAPSDEFTELRENLAELGRVVDAYVSRRVVATPARFNTNGHEVQKSDGEVRELLNKALENGKPVTFQPAESASPTFQPVHSIGSGQRVRSGAPLDISGVEKSDVADAELRRALGSGQPREAFNHRD